MSNEGQVDDHPTTAEFSEWLVSVMSGLRCEVCGNDSFNIYETSEGGIQMVRMPARANQKHWPAYFIACGKCGNMKLLSKDVVDQSIGQRREDK